MANFVVFGGTGNVGRIVVSELSKNNSVKILTRQDVSIFDSKNVQLIKGNVLDISAIKGTIDSGDIVIIVLGFNNSASDTMSVGTKNILNAMMKTNSRRVICLSAQGAGDSWDYMPEEFKKMVLSDSILKASFADHTIQEQFIRESSLDWTIVRPTEIVDIPGKGVWTENGFSNSLKFCISKFDVARFIIDESLANKYIRSVVMITN